MDIKFSTDWQIISVKPNDTLVDLLKKIGFPNKTAFDLLKSCHGKKLVSISPGTEFSLYIKNKILEELRYHVTPFNYIAFKKNKQNQFDSFQVTKQPDIRYQRTSFIIQDSLFSSGKRAHLNDKLLLQLANIFNYTIDLSYELHAGDQVDVLYEEYFSNNKKMSNGFIIAAQLIKRNKKLHAVRYTNKQGESGYYNLNGDSLEQSFMRSPVAFTYISSGFTTRRKHPIYGTIRPHRATDYAASMNTPVKASSDGVISFSGYQKGYGNVIFIKHRHKITTVYAHLNHFKSYLQEGSRVKGGDIIGFVGMTGGATGPHLHYEFRVNGIHQNPVTVKLPRGTPVLPNELNRFYQHTKPLLAYLTYNPNYTLVQASEHWHNINKAM
ncbi:MAG: M23 family metallopeptidase [Endozoicomonadaceae bacterium]|nr:M23 family metallopeptidase [Endozoicomonadaceae bacterium]